MVAILVGEHQLAVQQACRIAGLSRTAHDRPPVDDPGRDAVVSAARQAVVQAHPRWGFWQCFDRLRLLGHRWNHTHVDRVYCALRLNLVRRTTRRIPTRIRQPLDAPPVLNTTWALDFMHDALYDGRRFRTRTVLDEGNREGLAIEVGTSLASGRVVALLEQLVAQHGAPQAVRCDNGPELIAQTLTDWCAATGIALRHIQPGKPDQNAFIERFNRTYREEVLDAWLFTSLDQVRDVTTAWLMTYNTERPHDSLGRVPPLTFLPRPTHVPESAYELCA